MRQKSLGLRPLKTVLTVYALNDLLFVGTLAEMSRRMLCQTWVWKEHVIQMNASARIPPLSLGYGMVSLFSLLFVPAWEMFHHEKQMMVSVIIRKSIKATLHDTWCFPGGEELWLMIFNNQILKIWDLRRRSNYDFPPCLKSCPCKCWGFQYALFDLFPRLPHEIANCLPSYLLRDVCLHGSVHLHTKSLLLW